MTTKAKALETRAKRMLYLGGPIICIGCKREHDALQDTRNELSYREWVISGLCQKCQDVVFGLDSEPDER